MLYLNAKVECTISHHIKNYPKTYIICHTIWVYFIIYNTVILMSLYLIMLVGDSFTNWQLPVWVPPLRFRWPAYCFSNRFLVPMLHFRFQWWTSGSSGSLQGIDFQFYSNHQSVSKNHALIHMTSYWSRFFFIMFSDSSLSLIDFVSMTTYFLVCIYTNAFNIDCGGLPDLDNFLVSIFTNVYMLIYF
jgi:hypothetical protein